MHFLWWALVGLIAGWAAGHIMRGSGYGARMDIALGIAGSLLGGFSCDRWAMPAEVACSTASSWQSRAL